MKPFRQLLAEMLGIGRPRYQPRPHLVRIIVATDQEIVHRHANRRKPREVRTPLKRQIIIDRSKYSGEKLRALRQAGAHR